VVLHGTLGYAAEAGLLPDNPLDSIGWQVPQSSVALDPAVVASSAQVSALLDTVARTRPELTAILRAHVTAQGTAPDGRLFGGTRGGPLSGSVYGRAWQSARILALGPELAVRRPGRVETGKTVERSRPPATECK
jgi:hypothetical protein